MSPLARLCPSCGVAQTTIGLCSACEGARSRSRLRLEPWRVTYKTKKWRRARENALARDGHACVRCGASENLEAHHVMPLREGGSPTAVSNLISLCASCHRRVEASREAFSTPLGDDEPRVA